MKTYNMQPVSFYKCLADETRFQLIMLLQQHDELCVCEFIEHLDLSQPKISRHLAQLRKCEVLSDHRKGKWVYYRINPSLPTWALSVMKESYEGNKSNLPSLNKNPSINCCE